MLRLATRGRADPGDEALLCGAERARLAALHVPRRRAEWLAGRATAKAVVVEALKEAFPGPWSRAAIEIGTQPSGMPSARLAVEARGVAGFAPGQRLPVSVSISHTQGHAICAATCPPRAGAPLRALGVDLGVVEQRSRELVADFFTGEEQHYVRDGPAEELDLRANLIWCAKEAVLKTVGLGLTIDTLEVSCRPGSGPADPGEWRLAPADDGWHPFLATCGPGLLAGGALVRGIWRAFPGLVAALASRTAPGS